MTMKKAEAAEPDPQSLEETLSRCTLVFRNVPDTVTIFAVLHVLKGADILSAEKESNGDIVITYFSYFDAFKKYTETKSGILVGREQLIPEFIQSPLAPEEIKRACMTQRAGGSRNVMLSNLEDYMTADFLKEEVEKYGPIESFRYLKDRKIAYAEYFSFLSAINLVTNMKEDSLFQNIKTSFGRDKSGPGDDSLSNSRTVYFGGLSPDIDSSDILRVVKGGRVFSMKLLRDKKCAFITFFDYISAAAFLEYCNVFGLLIKGMQVKVGTGKVQPLPFAAPFLAWKNASRCIRVPVANSALRELLEQRLRKYGEIDSLIYNREECAVHAHYATVQDATSALADIERNPEYVTQAGEYIEDPCAKVDAHELILQIMTKVSI